MTTDELKALVRDVPDFPQEGIVFKDLMPLIGNAEGLAPSRRTECFATLELLGRDAR